MRILPIALMMLLLVSTATADAQDAFGEMEEPRLEIMTSRTAYSAGDRGFVVMRLDTYGKLESAEMEMEITSPSGKLVEGDILYTVIPEVTVVNPDTKQTVQVIYREGMEYFGPGKTVVRIVDFEVPMDAAPGEYTITGRAGGGGVVLEGEAKILISGPGGYIDVLFLLYIAALLYSLYLLGRS